MVNIVNSSSAGTKTAQKNRQRFMEKRKLDIIRGIDKAINKKDIKDFASDKNTDIDIENSTDQYQFDYSQDSPHQKNYIFREDNTDDTRGDNWIWNDQEGQGQGGAGKGEGQDSFVFSLTKEELKKYLFLGLSLPNFIKKNSTIEDDAVLTRCGYTKDGIPARLDIVKSYFESLIRRIAIKKKSKKKPRLFEENDLRYKFYDKRPKPTKTAHIYLLMDVSGSMDEGKKVFAKKFMLLTVLFLQEKYKKVDITFIRYHSNAKVCDEQEFFYSPETGGTDVGEALELLNSDITKNRNTETENIYTVWASDGDAFNFDSQVSKCIELVGKALHKMQYMVYVETNFPYYGRAFSVINEYILSSELLYRFKDKFRCISIGDKSQTAVAGFIKAFTGHKK